MKIAIRLFAFTLGFITFILGSHLHAADQSMAPPHATIVEGRAVPVVPHSDHSVILANKNPKLAANKRIVYDMWRTVINAGHTEEADKFFTLDYIEHNVMANTGREAFKARIAAEKDGQRLKKVPKKVLGDVVTILAEGDYVAMAFVYHYPEPDGSGKTYTSTKFDIFRLENGLIAEHWDSLQRVKGVPVATPEEGGPVFITGMKGEAQLPLLHNSDLALANNKRLVFDLWRHIPEAGIEELADIYLDPIYIQHNPNAVTGRAGFMEYFSKRPDSRIDPFLEDPLVVMIAEGDLVLQVLQEERENPENPDELYYVAWVDMFRIIEGRAAEHWDTASKGELPAVMRDALNNTE